MSEFTILRVISEIEEWFDEEVEVGLACADPECGQLIGPNLSEDFNGNERIYTSSAFLAINGDHQRVLICEDCADHHSERIEHAPKDMPDPVVRIQEDVSDHGEDFR